MARPITDLQRTLITAPPCFFLKISSTRKQGISTPYNQKDYESVLSVPQEHTKYEEAQDR